MKKVFAILLTFGLVFGLNYEPEVLAKGSSSRSFSSSGTRSSSSSSSGRSYSSGSSSSRPAATPSRSYSSGSSSSSTPSTSGSSPSRSYSSGSSRTSTSGSSSGSGSVSIKPGKTSFDTIGAKEQMKAESRKLYTAGSTPKTEYKTSAGKTATIDPKDTKIANLRTQLSHERWVNRQNRQQTFYGTYYSRPVVFYSDPYPSYFWWWMLDRSLDERAMWAYHHRNSMDQQRLRDLYAKDAQLEARVRAIEAKGVKVDPNYTPSGVDPDLMYTDDYVDAVYNPQGTIQNDNHGSSGWSVVLKIIFWLIIIGIVVAFAYAYFNAKIF